MKTPDQYTVEKMPTKPDPLWPSGAQPQHLSPVLRENPEVKAAFDELAVWKCKKCGTMVGKSTMSDEYCHECYAKEAQNTSLAQKINANWMEQSEELGLKLFERQPEETNEEWRIWEMYRSYYPMKLPTWSELAIKAQCSVAAVTKAAQKWSFRPRLVAWAQFVDQDNQQKRVVAIREMNEKQLGMATTIQNKLKAAIENIIPETLKPNEIVNLFKVATELERRVTMYEEEKVVSETGETAKKQVSTTKAEDLAEVVAILAKNGILDPKVFGIETTTRIVVKEGE